MRRVVAAEAVKLRGLPAIWATAGGTVAAGAVLGAATASHPGAAEVADVLGATVPFLQVGAILLGVLAVATEYSGRQIAVTLVAMPRRLPLLCGKAAAGLLLVSATAGLTVAAAGGAAWAVLARRGEAPEADWWRLAGMVAYLSLIGLLALAATVLLRSLVASLVVMEALVLIVSPLLATATEHARWLPDRAGARLYLPAVEGAWGWEAGGAVLAGWIVVAAAAGAVAFLARDA